MTSPLAKEPTLASQPLPENAAQASGTAAQYILYAILIDNAGCNNAISEATERFGLEAMSQLRAEMIAAK